ncbi:MAG: homogentisate 1,2-dioxygenase, partial [Myxococcota bacterium]
AGGRPSVRVRYEDWGLPFEVRRAGPRLARAKRVVVALHGRGSNASDFVQRIFEMVGDDPGVAVVAPQAPSNRWYEKGYRAPLAEQTQLATALGLVDEVLERVSSEVLPERLWLAGFSQGACLAAEALARKDYAVAGLFALSGARLGSAGEQPSIDGDRRGKRILLGASERDPFLRLDDIERTAASFRAAGAEVEVMTAPGKHHEIHNRQRIAVRRMLLGDRILQTAPGFGGIHESEALAGALPRDQNSPRPAPYGLYAEQVNATGFVAPRADNRRSWLYRIRPSAQPSSFRPLAHEGVRGWAADPAIDLVAWDPPAWPDEDDIDFVDGLRTLGGAGSPGLRRGYAVYLYAANRSMEKRALYNADGELLLIPERGDLVVQTELGVLGVPVGSVTVIPRGLRFSVLLEGRRARGYVAEVFGRGFSLPERGPVGANGLAEARHFRVPRAFFENRPEPGYRITAKLGGRLYDARQDYSPYDVVAWHGSYAPYVYALRQFAPVTNARVDHPDPSIYTVLSAPLDEEGAHCLDFVYFPPRVDATQHTFRPPFFHRNAVTEINGIIRKPNSDPSSPFVAGMSFVTPAMTPHGVLSSGVEAFLELSDAEADRPDVYTDESMWFQLESALPFYPARPAPAGLSPRDDWADIWGAYRLHYRPPQDGV